MCRIKSDPVWNDRLEASLPIGGPLVAFIGMCIVLFSVVG